MTRLQNSERRYGAAAMALWLIAFLVIAKK